jgi:O-antigen/teichoic acid export membrane protein
MVTGVTNVILLMLGFCTSVFAARLLGAEGRGELAAIQTWPTFVASLAMLGLADSLVYFSARDPARAGQLLASSMWLGLVSSVPFTAVGYIGLPILLAGQPASVVRAAQLYLAIVPLFALVGLAYHPLRGRGDFVGWNALRLTLAASWLALLITAWALSRGEAEFLARAYLWVLASLFVPVMCFVALRVPRPLWPDPRMFRPLLGYGWRSLMALAPQMLNQRLDQMLIVMLMPLQELGLYAVAVGWSSCVQSLLSALAVVFFPQVASHDAYEDRRAVFAQGIRVAVLIAAATAVVVAIITPIGMLMVFGSDFAGATLPAVVLIVAAAAAGLNLVLEEGFRGLGSPGVIVRAECLGVVMMALGLLGLLKEFGIFGAAIASLFGQLGVSGALFVTARQVTGLRVRDLLWPDAGELREIKRLVSSVFVLSGHGR